MIKKLLNFYKISSPLASGEVDAERSSRFKRIRWAYIFVGYYRIWHLLCLSP